MEMDERKTIRAVAFKWTETEAYSCKDAVLVR